MNILTDFQVDDSDDIIIMDNDLILEDNLLQASLNVAGRRIVSRYDDSPFRDGLCAGLERFLFSSNINKSIYDIKSAIMRVLARDYLFSSDEYDIKIAPTDNPREAKLYIAFKTPALKNTSTFKIFVDIENQRIYKG